jgi:transposase
MERYIGMDVHAQTSTLAVMGPSGRRLRELVVETNGKTLIDAIRGIAGTRRLCLEEGAQSQWLYELLERDVEELVVVRAMKHGGNKNDSIDAWALAEQLRTGATRDRRIFKGTRFRALRAAVRGQRAAMRDMVRAKNRLRAVYRARGIDVDAGVYSPKHRAKWQNKLPTAERKLAEELALHLDAMVTSYERANEWLETEAAKVPEVKRLCTVPGIGPVSASQVVATVIIPDRFRTKRQFWSYCGLAIVTRSSSDYVQDRTTRAWIRRDVNQTRGLNRNRHPILKAVFKSAATAVLKIRKPHPLREAYERTIKEGTKPTLAKLTLARRIAAATLAVWKNKEDYDPAKHCMTRTA